MSLACGTCAGNVVLLPLWLQQYVGYTGRNLQALRRSKAPRCSTASSIRRFMLSANDMFYVLAGLFLLSIAVVWLAPTVRQRAQGKEPVAVAH